MVFVKNKHGTKGSRECNIHHANTTKALLQTLGYVEKFVPKNSEGKSEFTKYTKIKYEYVGNLAKIKFLEVRIMAYDMIDPFIIPTLVDEYSGSIEGCWRIRAAMGVYLLSHWLKVLLRVVSLF